MIVSTQVMVIKCWTNGYSRCSLSIQPSWRAYCVIDWSGHCFCRLSLLSFCLGHSTQSDTFGRFCTMSLISSKFCCPFVLLLRSFCLWVHLSSLSKRPAPFIGPLLAILQSFYFGLLLASLPLLIAGSVCTLASSSSHFAIFLTHRSFCWDSSWYKSMTT